MAEDQAQPTESQQPATPAPAEAQAPAESAPPQAPAPQQQPQPLFGGLTYNQALQIDHNSGVRGIDRALKKFNLVVLIS